MTEPRSAGTRYARAEEPTTDNVNLVERARTSLRWPTDGHRVLGETITDAVISKVFPTHSTARASMLGVVAKVMRHVVITEHWDRERDEAAQAERDRIAQTLDAGLIKVAEGTWTSAAFVDFAADLVGDLQGEVR